MSRPSDSSPGAPMCAMHLPSLDLNLLLVFDAVMEERSVTRAGHRLGLTQSAVSPAMNRLRHLLKDELMVRGPQGMRPTPRALELAGPLRLGLAQIRGALAPRSFDPASAEMSFTIV